MKIRVSKSLYSFFVMVLYLVFGFILLLKYSVWQEEPSIRFSLFGLVIIAYGLYRGYRAYKDFQTEKENEDEFE
jgi:hypothetical protein